MRSVMGVLRLLVGLLKELSDETPYRRYLAAHGLRHSPEAWRQFSSHRLRSRFTNPRCC